MRRITYHYVGSHWTHTALTFGFRWSYVGKFGLNVIATYHSHGLKKKA